jgi:hypothetical protein
VQAQLADLTTRVKVIEEILTRWPQLVDRGADSDADTSADSADSLRGVQAQLADLTTRVKVIEEILTRWPQLVDRGADSDADTSADSVPIGRRRRADTRGTRALTPADSAPTGADARADTAPTDAGTGAAPAAPRRLGRPSGPLRQRILTLLAAHPEGLSAAELRVYLKADKPIGDTLQGMRKAGVVLARGQRPAVRYVVA